MRLTTAVRYLTAALIAVISLTAPLAYAQTQEPVTVFAAASLKNALEGLTESFTTSTGLRVRFSFAASSALAHQIESGAPADLFASADLEWMDYLQSRNLIRADTRIQLLGNRLVMIAPADSPVRDFALTPAAIQEALGSTGRIVTGETTSVPAGRYAKAALEKLGLWSGLQSRLAQAENVRAALTFVSRGEAPLGIVYETDAKADPKVRVVAAFPPDSHPPITYPFAITRAARDSDAPARFLAYLESAQARAVFEKEGFTVLTKPKPSN